MNTHEKIDVLETALDVLGEEGEHWAQGFYYGIKGLGANRALSTSKPEEDLDKANVFCLVGAVGEAAYRLGYVEDRLSETADRLANTISLTWLAQSVAGYADATYFNDASETSFADVRELIEKRITQLKGELDD